MQALAERLDSYLAGAPLAGATLLQFSALKTFDPPLDSFEGMQLERVTHRAKYLVFAFGGPTILIHLSQGGRVDVEDPPKTTKPRGSVARFTFRDRPSMLIKEFGTQRKAGIWTLPEGEDGPLARLGPEPFTDEFAEVLLTMNDSRRVHTILRDQRTVSGIGRGYSDDIIHRAQLSPYDALARLDEDRRRTLVDAAHAVLEDALAHERTRSGGLPTKIDDRFVVHGRYGSPCPVCATKLERVSYEDYEVTYCPVCQTGGKILADRRMSRLIR